METIVSRINIADTNRLAKSWRRASGGAFLPDDSRRQKSWDIPIKKNWDNMLLEADQVSRARLMATAQKESGAWLNALPVSSFGTRMDPESFRVAIALRVGADVCIPHSCRWRMDSRGLHGLSCKFSAGLFPRHSAMNDVFGAGGSKTVWFSRSTQPLTLFLREFPLSWEILVSLF